MISKNLFNQFQILEMFAFPEWQKSNEKKRLEITKKLGESEGQMIIDEIKKECEKLTKDLK